MVKFPNTVKNPTAHPLEYNNEESLQIRRLNVINTFQEKEIKHLEISSIPNVVC